MNTRQKIQKYLDDNEELSDLVLYTENENLIFNFFFVQFDHFDCRLLDTCFYQDNTLILRKKKMLNVISDLLEKLDLNKKDFILELIKSNPFFILPF